jgi:hypothetical protein
MNINGQTKSKKRISDHGEVFTAEREVNAMLDLVKQETERIDSRFLEPACGDGNFLAKILERKLAAVNKRYGKSYADYEKYSCFALTSIYGVDILMDNVLACQKRMFDIWNKQYTSICKKEVNEECCKAVKFILARNIQCGNALSLKKVNDEGMDLEEPIIFSKWSPMNSTMIKREDYRFDEILEAQEAQIRFDMVRMEYDDETKQFIPKPIRQFEPINYRKVYEYGE